MGPWIHFLEILGEDMGDLEFIQEKVLSGDYFQVSGDIDSTGTANDIEFIVPNGKTAFMIEAKIIPNNTGTNNRITAALKIATVIKDEAEIFRSQNQQTGSTNLGGSGYGMAENAGKFNVKGLSLVGNGVNEETNKITIENISDAGGAFATMSGYTIDT